MFFQFFLGDVARKFNWPDLDNIQIPVTNAQSKGISGLNPERKEKLKELTRQKMNGSGSLFQFFFSNLSKKKIPFFENRNGLFFCMFFRSKSISPKWIILG